MGQPPRIGDILQGVSIILQYRTTIKNLYQRHSPRSLYYSPISDNYQEPVSETFSKESLLFSNIGQLSRTCIRDILQGVSIILQYRTTIKNLYQRHSPRSLYYSPTLDNYQEPVSRDILQGASIILQYRTSPRTYSQRYPPRSHH